MSERVVVVGHAVGSPLAVKSSRARDPCREVQVARDPAARCNGALEAAASPRRRRPIRRCRLRQRNRAEHVGAVQRDVRRTCAPGRAVAR